jgi:hypothetical protein
MTAHQLAAKLLTLPDLPVIINDWDIGELAHEVIGASRQYGIAFQHADKSQVDDMGYGLRAHCIKLEHCD